MQVLRRFALIGPIVFNAAGVDVHGQAVAPTNAEALVHRIQKELLGDQFPPKEAEPNPHVPHGEIVKGTFKDSKIYPGTQNDFQVYVPAQHDPAKPACLLIKLDGLGDYEATVLDNLIAKNEIPVTIGIGIVPGTVWAISNGGAQGQPVRFDRSYEFDSVNDNFPNYVLHELLPTIEKLKTRDGRAIRLSHDGNDHAVMGASTGGIGAFTLAWRRPDQFTRVYSEIGTFVSMRGGNDYPAMIRKMDPKPIRVFLEDGSTDAWNPLFGSWYAANLEMEAALSFSGYDVAHAWGNHGHTGQPGQMILPDVLRWLWRDYPSAIKAGKSSNSTLEQITIPGEAWVQLPESFQMATGLAANRAGDVYWTDEDTATIYRLVADGRTEAFVKNAPALVSEAFGPDRALYGAAPSEKRVVAIDQQGNIRTVSEGIAGRDLVVRDDGSLFISEPGDHDDMPSRIWQLQPNGERKLIDEGLLAASGVGFVPDHTLFLAAESVTQWIYSYVVQPDGTFADKQRFFWLDMTDIPNNSGAENFAADNLGNLYVATRMGIQVCDPNGRVRAILPLPTPSGPVRSLCFGGRNFDVIYATDGTHVFKRVLKAQGYSQWQAPVPYKRDGAG